MELQLGHIPVSFCHCRLRLQCTYVHYLAMYNFLSIYKNTSDDQMWVNKYAAGMFLIDSICIHIVN